MVGKPNYQVHQCLDYYYRFNNQSEDDKTCTKVLLNLPMIKRQYIDDLKLSYDLDEHIKVLNEQHHDHGHGHDQEHGHNPHVHGQHHHEHGHVHDHPYRHSKPVKKWAGRCWEEPTNQHQVPN